jgi:hypothetical protein
MRQASHHEFFPERYARRLETSREIREIFEVVKDAVMETEGWSRSGLVLGLADLGGDEGAQVASLHPIGTNMIVLNDVPLTRVRDSFPELYKPYVFHILIHEYVHTIGIGEEVDTRKRVLDITLALFGEEHLATLLAQDIRKYLPFVAYPTTTSLPEGTRVEPLEAFDRSASDAYIG